MSFQNVKIIGKSVNSDEYHRSKEQFPRGDSRHPVSPSMLKLFSWCAKRWKDGYNPPKSNAKDFGSLVDARLLTPEQFDSRYILRPETYEDEGMECPICKTVTDSKTCRGCKVDRVKIKVTKDWNANSDFCTGWLVDNAGKYVISCDEFHDAGIAIDSLARNETIRDFIGACDKQALLRGEWLDKATGITIPCECLIDFWPREGTEFDRNCGDLKCVRSGALRPFRRQVFQMGWHVQGAFDLDMAASMGLDRTGWCIIGVENYAPFQPFKRMLSQNFLELGRSSYRSALARYAQCLATGEWPDYDRGANVAQGWSICEPENWMANEALEESVEALPELEPEPEQSEDIIP